MSRLLNGGLRRIATTTNDPVAPPPRLEQTLKQTVAPQRKTAGRGVAADLAALHAELRHPLHREVWSALLDDAYRTLQLSDDVGTLQRVFVALKEMRTACDPLSWEQFADVDALAHPIRELFHQDPFTRRSFDKPRGYAGDAVMLDYIYGLRPVPPETSEIGRSIFQFTTNAPASQSVRARRDVLAQFIDEAADRRSSPDILAVACGHLREAAISRAMQANRVGSFFALDQDADSLALIRETYAEQAIRTVPGSVKGILSGKLKFEHLDLVYAAGLYDYLGERVAARLTHKMFEMLAPGGRLLVANFAPCLRDIGYMETYMGWKLIYRTPADMEALTVEIPRSAIHDQRVFWDVHRNIVFLEMTRK